MANPLDQLRDAVVRVAHIGKRKLDVTFLRRERDALMHRLGSAVAGLIERGELAEPPQVADLVKAIRQLDERRSRELHEVEVLQGTMAGPAES